MAQALFDEHPLGEYLRDAGETPFSIPGITSDIEREIDAFYDVAEEPCEEVQVDWCPPALSEFLEVLESIISSTAHSSRKPSPFVERFKYNVISSSLLAPSLPTPHPGRLSRTFHIPGRLGHSRTPSLETTRPTSPPPSISSQDSSYGALSATVASTVIFFSIGFSSLAVLSLFVTIFLMYKHMYTTETPKHDLTSSLNALDDLIVANTTWDAVVQDAVTFLDNEERNLHTSTGPSSPSPIRVALHSSLQTTHTQCDNIRHLFSALTSPTELSQLSEMYAPPSPMKTGFAPEGHSRPLSYPLRSPTSPARTPESKRSTWNGSYSSLAYAGSPTNPMYRRDKHRVNLSDVFETKSAPVTPLLDPSATRLSEVPEDQPISSVSASFSPMANNFGSAALEIQRKRKSGGMDFLRSPPSASYSLPELRSPRRFSSTITSSSKFTSPQSGRHPLSYSALTYSLQGALSAKRYTCSHLLALRFSEEDDEGYWEDVRSVMGLLTSALVDASSRLAEALDEVEHQNLRDQNPTPNRTDFVDGDIDPMEGLERESPPKRQSKISFAPLPSHISRFAAHVAAIESALDDARENLEQCVAAIKEGPVSSTPTPSRTLRHSRSFSRMLSPPNANELEQGEHEALQAYERLRRELGLALRECERGRERLLEIVKPAVASDDEEEFDDVPGLAHDASASDDSDKPDPTSPAWDDEAVVAAVADVNQLATPDAGKAFVDDANPHLLQTTSAQHLPLPGIEEVFEADTGAKATFTRERSKLSREERIQLAKARRESGMGLGIGPVDLVHEEGSGEKPKMGGIEKWGPGGDVVEELKDVIWKVGERKRRMTVSVQAAQQTLRPTQSRTLIQSSIPESVLESSWHEGVSLS